MDVKSLVWKGKISTTTAFIVILINIGGDILFEYFLGGVLPIYGDIADLVLVAINFITLGPIALIGMTELVPAVDLLPIHMAIAIAGVYLKKQQNKR